MSNFTSIGARLIIALLVLSCLSLGRFAHAQCGSPDSGTCCAPNPTKWCEDEQCCAAVCAIEPFCCNVGWSFGCATLAKSICPFLCGECGLGTSVGHPCCTAKDTPYCYNAPCCESVCAELPHCCETAWDQECVDLAWQLCSNLPGCSPPPPPACGDPGTGNCCEANGSPLCTNATCCNIVCSIDPYCCDPDIGEWDECCVELADQNCPHPKHPGSLCNPAPKYDASACTPDAGDCCAFEGNDTPGCDDPPCCNTVCAMDPFCCEVSWDHACTSLAIQHCCGDPPCAFASPQGNCFTTGGTGCFDGDCCNTVCDCDFFCCEIQWDELCVGPNPETGCSAIDLCCPQHPECNPADLTGDNVVGVEDLLILLQSWGDCPNIAEHCPDPAECPADFAPPGGDLTVGVADLLFLLQNWG